MSSTLTPTLLQQGYSFGGWTEVAPGGTLTLSISRSIGLVFDLGLALGARLEALEPPIILSGSLTFPIPSAGAGCTARISLVPEAQPAPYGGTKVPGARGETTLADLQVLLPSTTTQINFTFTQSSTATLRQLAARSLWSGKLAFSIFGIAGTFSYTSPFVLSLQVDSFWRGLRGGPYGGKHRFVRDGRYGMPALNTQLVRDGDQPNLWVRPWDADPEDPSQEYRPRPGEGSIDDEIPEL